jgi:hypothetical protein
MKHRYLPRFDLPRRLRHCSPWSQAGTHAGHDHGFGGLLFMAKNMVKDRFGGENFFGDMFFSKVAESENHQENGGDDIILEEHI